MGLKTMKKIDKSKDKKHVLFGDEFKQSKSTCIKLHVHTRVDTPGMSLSTGSLILVTQTHSYGLFHNLILIDNAFGLSRKLRRGYLSRSLKSCIARESL